VLFNRTNSVDHVGKAAIFREGRDAIFAGYLIRLHLKEREVYSEFMNIFLNGDSARQYGRSIMGKSVNQANISASKLKDYPLPLPPLNEQKRIVRELAEIRESVRALNERYKQTLVDIADLRKSLLQRAFSGQLTA
jgi:type I restriction enzyme S subunit